MRSEVTATRADIAAAVRQTTGLPLIQTRELVDGILKHMCQALSRRENITIQRFGSFCILMKADRPGMNLKTGEPVVIPARYSLTFRPCAEMRSRVKKGLKGQ